MGMAWLDIPRTGEIPKTLGASSTHQQQIVVLQYSRTIVGRWEQENAWEQHDLEMTGVCVCVACMASQLRPNNLEH